MGSDKLGHEDHVASVFPPVATASSQAKAEPETSRAASSFLAGALSALLRSSRGALRHHGRRRDPVQDQGELKWCMTS